MDYCYNHTRPLQQGDEIRLYQKKLNLIRDVYHGLWVPLEPDGIFGRNTRDAVKGFQKLANLSPTGVLDMGTQGTIIRYAFCNQQCYNLFQRILTSNPFNDNDLSDPEVLDAPPTIQENPTTPQFYDIKVSPSSDLSTPSGRAKYIYNYLIEKGGLQQNMALGIMANMYRCTDGKPFPYNILNVDKKSTSPYKQMGGGLLGCTYHRSLRLAKKSEVQVPGCVKLINEMEAYAAKFSGEGPGDHAARYMMNKFKQGYPIPIDIQLDNALEEMESRCPSLKNKPFNTPKEASVAYLYNVNNPAKKNEKDPVKRKHNEGRWDRHGKDILNYLGM